MTGAMKNRPPTAMGFGSVRTFWRSSALGGTCRTFRRRAVCGPRCRLCDARGDAIDEDAPLLAFVQALRFGAVGALKGLGGYHLVCDARNEGAVAELRRRKQRDAKPFALMASDLPAVEALCEVSPVERELLFSAARPIVLLRRRSDSAGIAAGVAPGNPYLGVFLPYTPLHHLLMRAAAGMLLVMTSGNRCDEPIAYREDEAFENLAGIADCFLVHDRPIHVRCDDSVTRLVDGVELPVRRSRGYAPCPVVLPLECPCPVLAVGGQLKATFALVRGRQVFLSHHLGDLGHYEAYRAFVNDVTLYEDLFGISPACLIHDAHPDYATTRYAQERAAKTGIHLLSAQHHHAHLASCLAENGVDEVVIGVTFDGTGYGPDGAIWGGEFLIGDLRSYRRAAHLRYVGMPGGEAAIREPWRMAVAYLRDAGLRYPPLEARVLPVPLRTVERMLAQGCRTPLTSSVGRLFDAVASLLGTIGRVSYEGQAAVELEWLASRQVADGSYPFNLEEIPPEASGVQPLSIDTRPLIAAIIDDLGRNVTPALIARRFHTTMVEMIEAVCVRLRDTTGLESVALSGGVFQSVLLTAETSARLRANGFRVLRHRLVPPNDGGLSLGQAAIAAALLAQESHQGE
mgnify:CR=1 FL=1